MKKLIYTVLGNLLLICYLPVQSQTFNYAINVGGNINILSLNSVYSIESKDKPKTSPSFNLGGSIKTTFNRINVLGSVDYIRIGNRMEPGVFFTDIVGDLIADMNRKIINHNLSANILGIINITDEFYIGVGLSTNILLNSTLKLDNYFSMIGGKRVTNNYYRRLTFMIPIQMGYDFGKFEIYTRFNKGIMNRINGNSFVKEIDNIIMLCASYQLN